jgi:D-arginine dehydrogenase
MESEFDIVVIGGGIAGAAIASELASSRRVLLVDMEEHAGHHTTGRSAALFLLTYGNEAVRSLTRASRDFFYAPPRDFCETPLVKPRALLLASQPGHEAYMDGFLASVAPGDTATEISVEEACRRLPVLRPEGWGRIVFSESPADIEVHELLQGFLRRLKQRGGVFEAGSKVLALDRSGDRWTVTTSRGVVRAEVVVNAAGSWAGEIGRMAGAQEVDLRPLKRTACLIDPPAGADMAQWPMLADLEDTFYLKPDAGKLLISPADETLSEPCDAQADELDIAVAVDRIERATTLQVRRITHRWAGLRTFVPGRSPVVGYDRVQPGFFWLVALGGFGIQTAPALSLLAAALVMDRAVDAQLFAAGVDPEALSPRRLPLQAQPSEPLDAAA